MTELKEELDAKVGKAPESAAEAAQAAAEAEAKAEPADNNAAEDNK